MSPSSTAPHELNRQPSSSASSSQLTHVAGTSSGPHPNSSLHGNSDILSLAMGLERIQTSLINGVERPRFELRSELGVGGQGLVLSVFDRDCGRIQAFKILHEHRSDRDGIARFIHEAQVMAQLEHPGVVPIHDLNVLPDGTLYYSMKRVDGSVLADRISQLAHPENRFEALQLLLKVCDTMSYAHDSGVIHRDLKPANIMVGSYGEVLVVDWGLAKILGGSEIISPRDAGESGDAFATRCGVAVGTPSYMSPEQARGLSEEVDQRSDIFALGVILYELLVGASPYFPLTIARPVLEAAARGRWRSIHEVSEVSIPPPLRAIVGKAMAYSKQDRYARVQDLAADLRSFLAGHSISAYRESPIETLSRLAQRYRTPFAAVFVTAALGLLVVVGGWLYDSWVVSERVESLRHQAAVAIATGEITGAVAAYQRLLELRPDDAEAAQGVGRYSAMAERLVADRSAAEIQARNLQRAEELAERARLHLASEEEPSPALEALTQALALLPPNADVQRSAFLDLRDSAFRRMAEWEMRQQRARAAALMTTVEADIEAERWIEAQVALRQALSLVPASERSQLLESRIAEGLSQMQLRQQSQVAQRLLAEAEELRSAGDVDAAIANVQAVLALGVESEAPELLGRLLREQDQQRRLHLHQQALNHADRDIAATQAALAAGDIEQARAVLVRLAALQDEHPDIGRLRDLEGLRQRVEEVSLAQRRNQAMGEIIAATNLLKLSEGIASQLPELQQSYRDLEEELQQRPSAQNVRIQAHRLHEDIQRLSAMQSTHLSEAVTHLNAALALAPNYEPVRRTLAGFWAQRVVELERSGDVPAAAAAVAQGRHYDTSGEHRLVFSGLAVVESTSDQTYFLRRLETQEDRRDRPHGEVISLEPGQRMEVPHGRWYISNAERIASARHFERGSHYRIAFSRPQRELPAFMVFVPETPLYAPDTVVGELMGGALRGERQTVPAFFLAAHELTCGEYLEFLNDPVNLRRLRQNSNPPLSLIPRAAWDSPQGLWAFENGQFHLRSALTGAAIDPLLPLTNISRQDVDAYIQWRRQRDGLAWRLPRGEEWLAAVQAGDGRHYPWGRLADPAHAYSYLAAPTSTGFVERPVGSFPGDRSVHGIYDLAGSVAEFVEESWFGHDGVSVARGGSFADRELQRFSFRARRAVDNRLPLNAVGFRLAHDAD
ncbi:MAG: hypothetical protein EA402_08350 [Planctomycetota bacterium]|nr:MAG: hypothetical protein EA402_08350 [Planctomycetota bacterium]